MEVVKDGEKARAESRENERERTEGAGNESDSSSEEEEKKKKKPRKTRKMTEEEKERQKNIVVGPKIDASGAPMLPVRKAAPKPQKSPKKKKKLFGLF